MFPRFKTWRRLFIRPLIAALPNAEPGGREVMIEAEHQADAISLHQSEGQAIGEGDALVGVLLHQPKAVFPVVWLCPENSDTAGE